MTEAFATYRSDALKKCFDSTNGMSEGLATFDGKLMAIPDIQPGMDSVPLVYIRGDWMEELGLEEPKSLDDIVNIAKTFMEKNPGGNVTDGIAVGLSSDKKLVQKLSLIHILRSVCPVSWGQPGRYLYYSFYILLINGI